MLKPVFLRRSPRNKAPSNPQCLVQHLDGRAPFAFGTIVVPGAHVSIGTEGLPDEVAGHSQENADISVSEAGHRSLILTTKVMAASALRLLMDPELRERATAEHSNWVEEYNR